MHSTKNQVTAVVLRVAVLTAVAVALLLCSGSAWAQTFQVTYFDNNTAPGATIPAAYVHVVNPGDGATCADIYVWRADQELEECCSCAISNNGLLTFTVATATANPGDGGAAYPTSGSIDIIADSAPNGCSDSSAAAAPTPTGDLNAWATHVNVDTVGPPTENAYDVTETKFANVTLSSGEQTEASSRCAAILTNDTGHGVCDAICSDPSAAARTRIK